MITFTATIALHDDQGNTYDADDLTWTVTTTLPRGTSLFTIAKGQGIDSDTGATEPVVVFQGAAPDSSSLAAARRVFENAAVARNQRAIGWFESSDSYHYIPEGN